MALCYTFLLIENVSSLKPKEDVIMIREMIRECEELMSVEGCNNSDDLVHFMVEECFSLATQCIAAEKLLKMWKNDCEGGITLDHIVYVSEYADEPYKTEADEIIRKIV